VKLTNVYDLNPWWETGEVPRDLLPSQPRTLFQELRDSLDRRQAEVIVGLRRTGKTTLMLQLIDHLLRRGTDPRSILYFTFDERSRDLRGLLREYEERVLRSRLRDRRIYLFLDEVHKLPGWPEEVKLLYDFNPNLKLVLSGSASLNLMRGAGESLAGRCVFHRLDPLSFVEFLRLRYGESPPPPEDFEISERRLSIHLQEFLLRGFPEIVRAGDQEARRYVRELVLERILYRDIPQSFPASEPELLKLLAELLCSSPGMVLNVDSLSKELGRAKKTVGDYLSYLELSFVIRRLSNLRGSMLAVSRKNRKGYPCHPSLCTTQDHTRVIETLVMSETGAQFYWRLRDLEVDFVLRNGRTMPVEVKYAQKVRERDLRGIRAFCRRFGLERGLVITREEMGRLDGLELVPLLRFILYRERLLGGSESGLPGGQTR